MIMKLEHLAPYLPYGLKYHLPLDSERYDSIMENEPFRLALPFMNDKDKEECISKYKKMYLYKDIPEIMNDDNRLFLGQMKSSLGFEEDDVYLDEVLPILRPLSDLTKEIEHNGEKFVPFKKLRWEYMDGEQGFRIYCEYGESPKAVVNVLEYIDDYFKLLEWHFDVFNLREKDLCIYYDELK